MGFIFRHKSMLPVGHVPVAPVPLAAHGRAGLAEVAVDDVGEVGGRVRAEVRARRGVHRLLVHGAAGIETVHDACLEVVFSQTIMMRGFNALDIQTIGWTICSPF